MRCQVTPGCLARCLFSAGVLEVGDAPWASGKSPGFKIDLEVLGQTKHQACRNLAVSLLAERISDLEFQAIAGVPSGGQIFARGLCEHLLSRGRLQRLVDAEKDNSPVAQCAGLRVLIVEDVVSTGGSTLKFAQRIRSGGAEVTHAVAVLSHKLGASEALAANGITLQSVLTGPELLRAWEKLGNVPRDALAKMRALYHP